MDDLLARAQELQARGEPFALATVVRVERPASARPGMKAIVRADGTLEGWVGGSCAHPIVVTEGLRLLREGAPRLVRLSPGATDLPEQDGVIHHTMTCHSGGSLEIYIEPVLPPPRLLLVGETPLVRALAHLGRLAGFAVVTAEAGLETTRREPTHDPEADHRLPLDRLRSTVTPDTYAVVATMGADDEEALEALVDTGAAYIGLVASRKRAEAVFAHLRGRGAGAEGVHRVKVPAGLDIGAVTPEEIAVSIMAEIIQVRRSRTRPATEVSREAVATDPICGMTVVIARARYTVEHEGVRFYFCSDHCRHTFERGPARYVTAGP
ncbi:MAG: XdhC family protein [Armatimonadota bacterium]|nr:XdhC family protein [Armatimonadota bacterium]MDR7519886.1 XdhC family protein [Armatimonadota bacterium]